MAWSSWMHIGASSVGSSFFFFNDTATTEIYTLSLHDALPISLCIRYVRSRVPPFEDLKLPARSEEHTSELQSPVHLVCRLLLEKKKSEHTATLRAADLGKKVVQVDTGAAF